MISTTSDDQRPLRPFLLHTTPIIFLDPRRPHNRQTSYSTRMPSKYMRIPPRCKIPYPYCAICRARNEQIVELGRRVRVPRYDSPRTYRKSPHSTFMSLQNSYLSSISRIVHVDGMII